MVKSWYDEIEMYHYDRPKFSHETGHFTQVVWRSTTKLGCAMAKSHGPRGGVYLTCNYDPYGNLEGAFRENVLPKKPDWKSNKKKMKMRKKRET